MITDMTEGKPQTVLFSFTIPILLSSIFQQCYNMADSIIAGRFISEDALAAVGASYPVTMIFMSIAFGCNVGCSVVISQLFGNKDYKNMKTAINTSFISIITLSIILTILGLIYCNDIITAINTPDNIYSDSSLYLSVFFCGMFFLFLYNICTGIFTALGDSTTPLFFLIFSSVGNIILDIVLVVCFDMKVLGIALATLIMQALSSILAFICLRLKIKAIHYEGESSVFSLSMLSKISKMAIPSILQQSFVSVGNMMIQGLINDYGSSTIAGYSSAIKINTFAVTSFSTFANALSSFTAQNVGANKIDRVKEGLKSALIMGLTIVAVITSIYIVFSKQLINLFLDKPSPQSIRTGVTFITIVAPFYATVTIKMVIDGLLRGVGAVWLFTISTFLDLIIRIVLSFILNSKLGYIGIPISWSAGWVIGMAVCIFFYFSGLWKYKLNNRTKST